MAEAVKGKEEPKYKESSKARQFREAREFEREQRRLQNHSSIEVRIPKHVLVQSEMAAEKAWKENLKSLTNKITCKNHVFFELTDSDIDVMNHVGVCGTRNDCFKEYCALIRTKLELHTMGICTLESCSVCTLVREYQKIL